MGTMQQLGKAKERRMSARLQAIDGPWEGIQVQSSTGRIGHLREDELPGDVLTRTFVGEAKSSASKAKDPGHRITKTFLQKVQKAAKNLKQRWVYMVDLPYCEKGHMISEQQHFRYLIMEEMLLENWENIIDPVYTLEEWVDKVIAERLEANCAECHQ